MLQMGFFSRRYAAKAAEAGRDKSRPPAERLRAIQDPVSAGDCASESGEEVSLLPVQILQIAPDAFLQRVTFRDAEDVEMFVPEPTMKQVKGSLTAKQVADEPQPALPKGVQILSDVFQLGPHLAKPFLFPILLQMRFREPDAVTGGRHLHGELLRFFVLEEEETEWKEVPGGRFGKGVGVVKMSGFCKVVIGELAADTETLVSVAVRVFWKARCAATVLLWPTECMKCDECARERAECLFSMEYECVHEESVTSPFTKQLQISLQKRDEEPVELAFYWQEIAHSVLYEAGTVYRLKADIAGIEYKPLHVGQEFQFPQTPAGSQLAVPPQPSTLLAYSHATRGEASSSSAAILTELPKEIESVRGLRPDAAVEEIRTVAEFEAALNSGNFELVIVSGHREQDFIILQMEELRNQVFLQILRERRRQRKPNPACFFFNSCGGEELPGLVLEEGGVKVVIWWDYSKGGVPDRVAALFTQLLLNELQEPVVPDQVQSRYFDAAGRAKASLPGAIRVLPGNFPLRVWPARCMVKAARGDEAVRLEERPSSDDEFEQRTFHLEQVIQTFHHISLQMQEGLTR